MTCSFLILTFCRRLSRTGIQCSGWNYKSRLMQIIILQRPERRGNFAFYEIRTSLLPHTYTITYASLLVLAADPSSAVGEHSADGCWASLTTAGWTARRGGKYLYFVATPLPPPSRNLLRRQQYSFSSWCPPHLSTKRIGPGIVPAMTIRSFFPWSEIIPLMATNKAENLNCQSMYFPNSKN